jgi:hypothetical protein
MHFPVGFCGGVGAMFVLIIGKLYSDIMIEGLIGLWYHRICSTDAAKSAPVSAIMGSGSD